MHNPGGPFSQRHCVWLQYDWKDVSADLDSILMCKSQVSLCCQTHTKLLYQVAPYVFMNSVCGLRAVNEGLRFCVVNE